MADSLSCIYLHLIWSTKHRSPLITDGIRPALHSYMAGTFQNLNCPAVLINSVADHVHVLCRFDRDIKVRDLMKEVKQSSSKWIKSANDGGHTFKGFYWQTGYGAFSVGPTQVPDVMAYIAEQAEHHKKVSFQDELRRFLKVYKIAYDERYVWD
jgi:putative transposase